MANDVELNDRRVRVIAEAGQTVFDIDFPILTEDDLSVYLNGQLITDYNVSLKDMHVTFNVGTSDGDIVTIEGNTQPIRETAYPLSGALPSSLLNKEFKRLLYIAQELRTYIGRSISLAQDEDAGIAQRLPKAETGKMLKWGSQGLVNSDTNIDDLDGAVEAAQAAQMEAESAAAAAGASAEAANLSRQAAEAASVGMKWRGSVKVCTTENIVLSGLQTINGVAVSALQLVLVKNQTNPAQNGVYVVSTGAWSRVWYADIWAEIVGLVVTTEEGVEDADMPFICISNSGGTLGVTAITFTYLPSPVIDGGISRAAQIVAGLLNYAHVALSAIATQAEALAGAASKFINADIFKKTALIQYSAATALTGLTPTISGIPPEAKRVTIYLRNFSLSGSADSPLIRLGTAAGIQTTDYLGSRMSAQSSGAVSLAAELTGIVLICQSAATIWDAKITLDLVDPASNMWHIEGHVAGNTSARYSTYVGGKSMGVGTPLDRVQILTDSGTFDLGFALVTWEF